MKLKLLMASVLAAVSCASLAHAGSPNTNNYRFWFTSDGDGPGNPLGGKVHGIIYGLSDGWSYASDIVITSAPAYVGAPSTPFSINDYATSQGLFINQDLFHVSNKQIDFAIYQIWGGSFDINIPAGGLWYEDLAGPTAAMRVQNVLGSIHFSVAPEPSTWAMMMLGFGGLGAAMRARRKPVPATA
jgi:hypothetical protein